MIHIRDLQFPFRLQERCRQGFRSPLARRFVLYTVLCSTLLAVLMTAIQLYADFRSDRSVLHQSVENIKETIIPSLIESLWLIDEVLINTHLEGIAKVEGVVYVRIIISGEETISAGEPTDLYSDVYKVPLIRQSDVNDVALGNLEVFVSFNQIFERLIKRGILVLTTNTVKSFVVAVFIMLIYQLLIGRHLARLAVFADEYDPGGRLDLIALRPYKAANDPGDTDELALLEMSMNRWVTNNHNYIHELREAQSTITSSYRKLEITNSKLHNANREQAEFSYAISHDLKSPNNTMAMLIEELEQYNDLSDGCEDIFTDIRATNSRMGQLIDDVLKYSQVVEEKLTPAEVNLNQIVDEIIEDLAADIAASDATFLKDELPTVTGHPMQLRILFQNILANAVKFRSPERASRVKLTSSVENSGQVSVTISDNGIGIPEAHREKIFGLFQRLHAQSCYEGTGLGLAICSRVMANHNGKISLETSTDGGASFTLTFLGEKL